MRTSVRLWRFFIVGILLLWPSSARAQTHPCDVVPPSNPQLTSPVKGGFCHSGKDVDGNTTTITAFKFFIDGQVVFQGALTPIGPATSDGRFYYETPAFVVSRGNHAATFTAVSTDGESVPTLPFVFVCVGAVPAPPSAPRVKK